MGGLTARAVAAVLAGMAALALTAGVARAADVEFGEPTASATFGQSIEFVQPVVLGEAIDRVELRLTFSDADGPTVIEVPGSGAGTGQQTLRYTFTFAEGGHILPNTRIEASWRVYGADDLSGTDGPSVRLTYEDDRFDWRTLSGDLVRVHWYEGGDRFGQRALEIGEAAVRDTAALLGVTEEDPVDFFIYADQGSFYDALGPGTRENVGGQANAGIRTLFALITPGEIDDQWVGIVIPHELVHLVFDTAVRNPYHFPPRWLNEGLATYLSQGYDVSDRLTVESAAADGSIIPLEGLVGQFPTTRERFFLAYAESVAAVDYLIRTHGDDALVGLIRSYADGRTDDEAFRDALGVDMAGFGEAWLASLEATPPRRYGPQPAPAGPQPPGWESGGATPGPGAPAGSDGPTLSSTPGTPAGGGAGGDNLPIGPMAVIVVVAGVLIVGALVIRRRRVGAG